MAYQDIATINIALQTAGITTEGFGTPLFITSSRYFPERVRTYGSLLEAAEDLPTTSAAYKALTGFFSNTPSVSAVKIGRREADLDLVVATPSTSASLTFYANDGTTTYPLTISITGSVDASAVATAIAAAIEGDSDIGPLVVASASSGTVSIDVAGAAYSFWVKNLSSNLSETYSSIETASEVMSAISEEDNDFYFVTAEDHTQAFVLALAADVEARTKLYFTSSQESASLGVYNAGASTDTLGKLRDLGLFRTKGMFSDTANTTYPECAYVGYNAPFLAGSVTWTNLNIALPAAKDPVTGFTLSTTQKSNLDNRNAAFVEIKGGLNILRGGKVAGGERVDIIRGRDNLDSDLDVAYTNLLVSQQGSKVPYNDEGITALEAVCSGVLTRYVTRNFINSNFKVSFPRIDKVPTSDKQARQYNLGKFSAELTGAIEFVSINGTLALDLS